MLDKIVCEGFSVATAHFVLFPLTTSRRKKDTATEKEIQSRETVIAFVFSNQV